uniref:Uncharacterized protein n=1 Tax=Panagrolaimus sp. PS1159 TaxID=55785 RepID=A0AC35GYL2_9BILA
MPNLNNLVADFSANPEQQMFTWKRVYKEMKKFNPEMFKHIPTKVKGSFNFYVVEFRNSLKEKFDIHDGLTFEFILQVSEEEESEDEFEDESEGGSDEEIPFHDLLNAWQGDLLYALQGALHGHIFDGDENDGFEDAANANDEI